MSNNVLPIMVTNPEHTTIVEWANTHLHSASIAHIPQPRATQPDKFSKCRFQFAVVLRGKKKTEKQQFAYFCGVGHSRAYKLADRWDRERRIRAELAAIHAGGLRPQLLDILYCLAMDADVLNHSSFESWATDFGYDVDSREARRTYHTCVESANKLAAVLGGVPQVQELQSLFQAANY